MKTSSQWWAHLKWWIQLMHPILADKRVAIRDISEQLGILVGTAHKIVHDKLVFSKASWHWVSPGQCKASYFSKNSRHHQSVWLGTATISLQSRSAPTLLWFPLVLNSARNKVIKQWWNKEHHEQMVKDSVQRFLEMKEYQSLFFLMGKMCFNKWRLKRKIK